MKTALQCKITSNARIGDSIFRLTVESGALAAAGPGQFAMLKCGGAAFLRRPLSICDVDGGRGEAAFVYRVSGAGTRALSAMKPGGTADIVGPLGTGFPIVRGRTALVGGGMGAAPLLLLAKRLNAGGEAPDIFVGFQSASAVILDAELKALARAFSLASDDGSAGEKCFVTDAFLRAAEGPAGNIGVPVRDAAGAFVQKGGNYDAVFACGPLPMLEALGRICEARGIPAWFSLEQRMGCGIGACRVCACAVRRGGVVPPATDAYTYERRGGAVPPATGAYTYERMGGAVPPATCAHTYARVCKDGPVFFAGDLAFDEFRR